MDSSSTSSSSRQTVIGKPAVVVPEYVVTAGEFKEVAKTVVTDPREYRAICSIIDNTLVTKRHFVAPITEIMARGNATADVSQAVYAEAAYKLGAQAALAALETSFAKPQDIDAIITVSCTGISMPSLGARMANELGFRASVDHLPVSQWGCSGGVASLKWADIYCRANPRAAVLVLCVEVCSAMWHAELDRGSLVCAALFGDAAGGVVVMGPDCPLLQRGPQRVGMTLAATREHLIPNSSHWMYYDVDAKGLHFRLSKAVSESMNVAAPVIAEFAKEQGQDIYDPLLKFVVHTGGPKILCELLAFLYPNSEISAAKATADSQLTQQQEKEEPSFAVTALGSTEANRVDTSLEVLRSFGNIASVTALAALRQTFNSMEAACIDEAQVFPSILIGCGPGMSVHLGFGQVRNICPGQPKAAAAVAEAVPYLASIVALASIPAPFATTGAHCSSRVVAVPAPTPKSEAASFDVVLLGRSRTSRRLAALLHQHHRLRVALVDERDLPTQVLPRLDGDGAAAGGTGSSSSSSSSEFAGLSSPCSSSCSSDYDACAAAPVGEDEDDLSSLRLLHADRCCIKRLPRRARSVLRLADLLAPATLQSLLSIDLAAIPASQRGGVVLLSGFDHAQVITSAAQDQLVVLQHARSTVSFAMRASHVVDCATLRNAEDEAAAAASSRHSSTVSRHGAPVILMA